jgi:hypothetical protein
MLHRERTRELVVAGPSGQDARNRDRVPAPAEVHAERADWNRLRSIRIVAAQNPALTITMI